MEDDTLGDITNHPILVQNDITLFFHYMITVSCLRRYMGNGV